MPARASPLGTDNAVQLRRCRDPVVIEKFLRSDYYDRPIRHFPAPLIRSAADWFAKCESIYFITAEADGQHAGFVFGHIFGSSLWREFVRQERFRHPLALAWVGVRSQVWPPLQRFAKRLSPRKGAAPVSGGRQGSRTLEVPRLDRPFAWSADDPSIGRIPMLAVRKDFRGRRLAPRLISRVAAEMASGGVTRIEAHVDPDNIAAVRAYLKARWEVFRAATNDFYVCYHSTEGSVP